MATNRPGFYILIPAGGPATVVPCDDKIGLDLLQAVVGDSGMVDVIQLDRRGGRSIDLWVDDEGLLRNPPRWNRLLPNGQPLAGTALLCASDKNGDSVPLTAAEASAWLAIVSRWPRAVPGPPRTPNGGGR